MKYDYKKLKITRLEETVSTANGKVTLRTDLVPFLYPVPGEKNTHLLVYSVRDERIGKTQLISGFPVEASFVERALDPKGLGENLGVITRYNAVVPGVTGEKLRGSRRRIEVARGR